MKTLFKNKNYTLLFMGSLVSEAGNVLFSFVSGLYVQEITNGSALIFGLFLSLGACVRLLFSPIAGVLVDRWNKIRIIYVTDYLRGMLFILLAIIFFSKLSVQSSILLILAMTVIMGIISSFFGPAITSATPEIVGNDLIQQAYGANTIIRSLTMMIGIILGAVAYNYFSFPIAMLINGLTFIFSGFSEMFIHTPYTLKKKEKVVTKMTMINDFRFGIRYLFQRKGIMHIVIYSLFMNFAVSPMLSVGVPYLFKSELNRDVWEIAWPNLVFGISMTLAGLLIGSIVIKRKLRFIRVSAILLSSSFVFMTLIIYALSHEMIDYWTFYVLHLLNFIVLAIFMIGTNIPLDTSLMIAIDPKVHGRVFSTIGALASAAVPISIFLGGFFIELSSVATLGLISSAILVIPVIGFSIDRHMSSLFKEISEMENKIT